MVWFISGKRNELVLDVLDTGGPACHGQGHHKPLPPGLNDFGGGNIDHALLNRIQAAKCSWSLYPSSESQLHIDGGGDGLFERVQKSPDASHGMFKFYEHSSDTVSCSVVVSETTFIHIRRLFELVLLCESLEYVIVAEFLGFRVPHAQTETPTWREFIEGRPLFFNKVSLSVRVAASHVTSP